MAHLITEAIDKSISILIVSPKDTPFIQKLRTHMRKYTSDIYFSSTSPKDISKFDYCFMVDDKKFALPTTPPSTNAKLILIFFNAQKRVAALAKTLSSRNIPRIKLIQVTSKDGDIQDLDKLLWFSFSQTGEQVLQLTPPQSTIHQPFNASSVYHRTKKLLTRQRMITGIFLFIVFLHLAFIPFIAISSFLFFKSATAFNNEQIARSEALMREGSFFYSIARNVYAPVRPVYLFFSLALPLDTIFEINDKAKNALTQSQELFRDGKQFITLLLKKNKSVEERSSLTLTIFKIQRSSTLLKDALAGLTETIPGQIPSLKKIKVQLAASTELLTKLEKLIQFSDIIFAKGTEKKYLLLFANNRELRPGGGFIGSFGTLTFHDYTLSDLKIYDVYDADGQLTAHIEPPAAIRKYLSQPHWFLRDSGFSPDFLQNYAQAKFFLQKEMGFSDFSGAVLITTSALENILLGFGDIYLSDFGEKVNSRNFYLKAQIYAQNNFFPGSIQKKGFLGSLTRQILLNIDSASFKTIVSQLKKSLDEKQLVLYLDYPQAQELFDSSYWSGRLIQPNCAQNVSSCFVDYVYPIDANLGVNKANYFITRLVNLRVRVDSAGNVYHVFTVRFKNDSPSEGFPGGTYHNYFQLMLPLGTQIKSVTKDGVLVDSVDQTDDQFTTVGFIVDVPPQKNAEIRIDYISKKQITKGNQTYQLVIQKQIGSSNNDFSFDLSLPSNIDVLNQNLTPLVKDNRILYNTSLTADKIFFVELIKQ